MPHHDLVIIGSGSGNSLLTPALEGLDVALVEKGTFGGTCLNVGCIPTKMFVLPADRVVEADDAHRLGVTFARRAVDWPAIRDRVFGRIDPISRGGEAVPPRPGRTSRCTAPGPASPARGGWSSTPARRSPPTASSSPPAAGPSAWRSTGSPAPTRPAACTRPTP